MSNLETVMSMLGKSYSCYHAVKNIEEKLLEKGFSCLDEKKPFAIKKGGCYYVKRNDSSIIAFKIPNELNTLCYRITATHTDSPTWKLKPNPVIKNKNIMSLGVEAYGGGLYYSFLDRPLSVAGRVMIKDGSNIKSSLLAIDEDLAYIPSVCIHMNRNANSELKLNPAVDMLPMLGEAKEGFSWTEYLNGKAGGEVLSYDLFIYARETPRLVGIEKDFLSAPRLDDLASSYGCLLGFIDAVPSEVAVYASFDNEEVGSLTKQGANSTFMKDTLKKIAYGLGYSESEYIEAVASSCMLSVDNAHANHPNHPELSDKTTDVRLNGGIVIKYNANQSYTSDGFSSSIVKMLCSMNELPYQEFTNRSDLRGGSTLGNISNSEVSLTTVDIGLAQLAMHSANEIMGSKDVDCLVKLAKAFYATPFALEGNSIVF